MLDQAHKLRQMVINQDINEKSMLNKSKIITVTSGKGGVGKSNFVVNIAIALQKKGKKVMIFDGDVGMSNDDILIGTVPKYNVFDVIFKDKEIEDVIIEGPYGIKLLSGGTALNRIEEFTIEQREKFLKKLIKLKDLDYVFIDTSAGVNKNVLGFIACSEELILITTPEPTALMDAYSLLKTVKHFDIKIDTKVIINKILNKREGEKVFNKFSRTAYKFLNINIQHLGNISEDKKIVQGVRKQEPFIISFPNCNASKDIDKISNRILGERNFKKSIGIQGLFEKFFDIFHKE